MTNKDTLIKLFLIIIILILSLYSFFKIKKLNNELEVKGSAILLEKKISKSVNNSFIKIKRENDSLYKFINEIKLLKPEKVTEIKTITKIVADSSINKNNKTDSLYIFTDNNKNYSYRLSIKANNVSKYNLNVDIYDNIRVVDNGENTFVETSNSTIIDNITYVKNKGVKKFNFNVGVGFGYGLINKKPDVFIGVGFGYNF